MRGSVGEVVVGELQCFVHDAAQVSVGQGVDDAASFLAGGDQAAQAQTCQVLADGGALGAARLGQCGDVRFLLGEGVQQGQTGAVAEEGEDLGCEGELFLTRFVRVRIMRS